VRLLNAYVLPVLLRGAETWSLTATLEKKLDAFHQWCLRRLLRLSYLRHVTNVEVLHLTCQTQLSTTLRDKRLRFLVISRGPTAEWTIHMFFDPLFLDCHAIGNDLPVDRDELEQDLRPLNIGLVSAWQRAQDRERWKRTVETATLQDGACS